MIYNPAGKFGGVAKLWPLSADRASALASAHNVISSWLRLGLRGNGRYSSRCLPSSCLAIKRRHPTSSTRLLTNICNCV